MAIDPISVQTNALGDNGTKIDITVTKLPSYLYRRLIWCCAPIEIEIIRHRRNLMRLLVGNRRENYILPLNFLREHHNSSRDHFHGRLAVLSVSSIILLKRNQVNDNTWIGDALVPNYSATFALTYTSMSYYLDCCARTVRVTTVLNLVISDSWAGCNL